MKDSVHMLTRLTTAAILLPLSFSITYALPIATGAGTTSSGILLVQSAKKPEKPVPVENPEAGPVGNTKVPEPTKAEKLAAKKAAAKKPEKPEPVENPEAGPEAKLGSQTAAPTKAEKQAAKKAAAKKPEKTETENPKAGPGKKPQG
jgi:hypothetical protein